MKKIYFRKFKNFAEAEQNEFEFWLSMKPEKRVAVVDSCLIDFLRLQGKSDDSPPRLQRVCRVIKRKQS